MSFYDIQWVQNKSRCHTCESSAHHFLPKGKIAWVVIEVDFVKVVEEKLQSCKGSLHHGVQAISSEETTQAFLLVHVCKGPTYAVNSRVFWVSSLLKNS